jgi:cell division protein FtsB
LSQRTKIVSFDAARRDSSLYSIPPVQTVDDPAFLQSLSNSSNANAGVSGAPRRVAASDFPSRAKSRNRAQSHAAALRSVTAASSVASVPGTSKSTRGVSADASLSDEAFWAEIRGNRASANVSGRTGSRSSARYAFAADAYATPRRGDANAAGSQSGRAVDPKLAERFGGEDDFDNEAANAEVKSSKAKRKKRQRTKERAGKMFAKQFGGDDSQASKEGPRAAVYEGKMGKTGRKMTRLVPADKADAIASRFNPLAWLTAITMSKGKVVALVLAGCFAFACATVYPSAQQYYKSIRDNDRTQAQYAALESRDDSLQDQYARLVSDVGVETIAHRDYGWVKSGEETATVEGLSDSAYAKEEAGSTITANVSINNIAYPETWYSPVLDKIFGVE